MLRNCLFMLRGVVLVVVGGLISEILQPISLIQWSHNSVEEVIYL